MSVPSGVTDLLSVSKLSVPPDLTDLLAISKLSPRVIDLLAVSKFICRIRLGSNLNFKFTDC